MKNLMRRFAAAICVLALCLTSASALSVEEARKLLEENYVDGLPPAAYEATTLDELFQAVGDPYTYYMDAANYEQFFAGVESETTVTGIGAGIEYTADGIRIIYLLSGGGAEEIGLQIGDMIIAVGDVSCAPAQEAHRNLIIGEEGTYVDLTVRHPDGTEQAYHIERRTLTMHNTNVTVKDGVGTIDCDSFGSQTAQYFADGIEAHQDDARVWIVDLRNNTGGYADAAVGALGAFTGFGPKLTYRLSNGQSFNIYHFNDRKTDKSAIVLVNGWSASASEILSGGIRAQKAGIVVGQRTYGKGTAQIVLDKENNPELFDGDSLKVTAYRFYCSDGNTTDRIGVLPTLYVSDACAADVARLLSGEKPKSGEFLRLMLNGCDFYVSLADAKEKPEAFRELLAALPPDAEVALNTDDGAEMVSSADLLTRYDSESVSRRFTDVAQSPYATQIDTLATYGILRGVDARRFDPDGTLTRAQLCALLAQALNTTSSASGVFSDVPDGRWYTGDVNAMASLGFVNGVGGGRFDPDGTLTQEQFITVMGRLTRFLNYYADNYALSLNNVDIPGLDSLASWSRVSASVLTSAGDNILYKDLDDIDLSSAVTREQAAATLCNMFKVLGILAY